MIGRFCIFLKFSDENYASEKNFLWRILFFSFIVVFKLFALFDKKTNRKLKKNLKPKKKYNLYYYDREHHKFTYNTSPAGTRRRRASAGI